MSWQEEHENVEPIMRSRPASAYAGRLARGEVREEPLVFADLEDIPPSEEEPTVCALCGRSFRTAHGLRVHHSRAHKVEPKAPLVLEKPLAQQLLGLVAPNGWPDDFEQLKAIVAWVDEGLRLRG